VIIVDDLIDTGDTVVTLANKFQAAGAKNIYVSASHGIFTRENIDRIDSSPITKVIVTNSLPIPENVSSPKIEQVSLGPLLARVIWTEHFRSNLKNFEE
jgi:ribose-phosphate pyrophosphokinase